MENERYVKIDIIGGFLGAGKTTFLNKLLNEGLASERVVIIENEFGDEPIDDVILGGNDLNMRTLPSGCICCTLKVDFITTIDEIVRTCSPDRILIEPTGLASPNELCKTCNLVPQFKELPIDVRLNSITAIVDATDVVDMLELEMPSFTNQVAQARLVLLSHTQELSANSLEEARRAIAEVAPDHTMIIDTPWDEIDALEVLSLSEQAYADSLNAQRDYSEEGGCDHDHEHHDHGHHHSWIGFSSASFALDKPFSELKIDELCKVLKAANAIRAKGFIPMANGLLHYEYVNGRANVSSSNYNGPAKLVAIGRGLNEQALKDWID